MEEATNVLKAKQSSHLFYDFFDSKWKEAGLKDHKTNQNQVLSSPQNFIKKQVLSQSNQGPTENKTGNQGVDLIGNEYIFVNKERENCMEQHIDRELKEARINFYKGKADKSIQLIEEQFREYKKECWIMTHIIRHKLDSLKVVSIEYKPKIKSNQSDWEYLYSISAFHVFKALADNRFLTQFTLKGIYIQKFQQELKSIQNFRPSKSLKLALNAHVEFSINQNNEAQSYRQINDLTLFVGLFKEVGSITAVIKMGQWKTINHWSRILLELWRCLRLIKAISLEVGKQKLQKCVPSQLVTAVRSLLIGELSSFTEIAELSLIGISFNQNVRINDELAMEHSLRTLFENNPIVNLKLKNCLKFPNLPQISTLQSIDLRNYSFNKQTGFMNRICRANRQLRSIKYSSASEDWIIDEQTLNQLQVLVIFKIRGVPQAFSRQNLSNLKYLSLSDAVFGSAQRLSQMFPKLSNLKYLQLNGINCGYQTLQKIPSTQLEEIDMNSNQTITDSGLKGIDSKWPCLKSIALMVCPKVTEMGWADCEFKGLMEQTGNLRKIGEGQRAANILRSKGVKVKYQWSDA